MGVSSSTGCIDKAMTGRITESIRATKLNKLLVVRAGQIILLDMVSSKGCKLVSEF